MCPAHWGQVLEPVRRAVRIAWNRSQGAGSPAHTAAIRLAIAAVNRDVVPASSLNRPARGLTFQGSAAGRSLTNPGPGGPC